LEGAIELDPKYAAAYFHRGIAKQGKGDLKGAIGINGAIERNDQDFYPRLFPWLMPNRNLKHSRSSALCLSDCSRPLAVRACYFQAVRSLSVSPQ
jgi:hypothetical protein